MRKSTPKSKREEEEEPYTPQPNSFQAGIQTSWPRNNKIHITTNEREKYHSKNRKTDFQAVKAMTGCMGMIQTIFKAACKGERRAYNTHFTLRRVRES